jgi:hypothetical protein
MDKSQRIIKQKTRQNSKIRIAIQETESNPPSRIEIDRNTKSNLNNKNQKNMRTNPKRIMSISIIRIRPKRKSL